MVRSAQAGLNSVLKMVSGTLQQREFPEVRSCPQSSRHLFQRPLNRVRCFERTTHAIRGVLLASHTGALLFPLVGYQQCGLLVIFVPLRK
jgi:hypothetical protein